MKNHTTLPTLSDEYAGANLGDPRRAVRAGMIADAAARAPSESLPKQARDDGQLEATYRFLGNKHVRPEALLDAHAECVAHRATEHGEVLVIHDTSKFEFGGELVRDGLGPVAGPNTQGFLSHASICVTRDGQPLGTIGLYSWARSGAPKGKRSQQVSQYDPDRESLRWSAAVHTAEERLDGRAEAVHVMDREGDCMELFGDLLEHDYRFVIRLAHDRRLKPGLTAAGEDKLYAALTSAPVYMEREVVLSPRSKTGRTPRQHARFPARATRGVRLEVRAQCFAIAPGNGAVAHLPKHLRLNFVEVREVNPPEGQQPVLWRLVTTEPIDTAEQVAAIVDIYCLRWLIEEYFKALKTGCNYESLQLETGMGLMRALAIYASVAWRLLLMRWLDRNEPDAPARVVVSSTQLDVLHAVRAAAGKPLPKKATVHDVLTAVAALGGHLKRNGAPGWLTLGRGFDTLLVLEQGWRAAVSKTAGRRDL